MFVCVCVCVRGVERRGREEVEGVTYLEMFGTAARQGGRGVCLL